MVLLNVVVECFFLLLFLFLFLFLSLVVVAVGEIEEVMVIFGQSFKKIIGHATVLMVLLVRKGR